MFSRVLPTCIVGGGTFSHEAQSFTRLPCFWPPALDKRARTQHHILNYGITWWMCLYLKIFQGSRSPSFKWWKDGLNICPLVHLLVHNTWQHRGDSNINKVYVVIGFIVVLDDYGQVSCEVMTHRYFPVVFSGEWGRWKLQLAMSPWQAKAQAGWWDNQISPPPTSPPPTLLATPCISTTTIHTMHLHYQYLLASPLDPVSAPVGARISASTIHPHVINPCWYQSVKIWPLWNLDKFWLFCREFTYLLMDFNSCRNNAVVVF